jgi:hypothetical protein
MNNDKIATILALIFFALGFAWNAYPTQQQKNAGGLRLSTPVECPDSVQFSWTGGSEEQTKSIYRRLSGTNDTWERIAMGLTGVSGTTFVEGFTLDRSYDYEIREDIP